MVVYLHKCDIVRVTTVTVTMCVYGVSCGYTVGPALETHKYSWCCMHLSVPMEARLQWQRQKEEVGWALASVR